MVHSRRRGNEACQRRLVTNAAQCSRIPLLRGRPGRRRSPPGDALQQLIGGWLAPPEPTQGSRQTWAAQLQRLIEGATSTTIDGTWTVTTQHSLPEPPARQSPEEQTFWPTYHWQDNPAILDQTGKMLTGKKYDRIQTCTLAELHIQRTGTNLYTMQIPTKDDHSHRQPKLRRWGLAVISSAPRLAIGEQLQVGSSASRRHPTQLKFDYTWTILTSDRIRGDKPTTDNKGMASFELVQWPDGIHWSVGNTTAADATMAADISKLQRREREGNIVFNAHPTLHDFPWTVPDSIANKHVQAAIKKQVFRRYRGDGASIASVVKGLQQAASSSEWQEATLQQTPRAYGRTTTS